jgi:heme exporter protein C
MMREDRDTLGLVLIVLSSVAMAAALAAVFLYAPREMTMGDVQRIFYFHVSSAWVGFFAFFVTFLGGVAYLVSGKRRWDVLAVSSTQIGLTFITMAVITGSLWARPVWGTYWTWEPRLTISAIQLLVYVAYGMLRGAVDDPEKKARFSSVYGIVAFVTVPLSWFAIRWWRTAHPDVLTSGEGMAFAARMGHTLLASLVAFTLLYITILRQRIRLARTTDTVMRLRAQLDRSR